MNPFWNKELDVAKRAALAAADAILSFYGSDDLVVTHKDPRQPLTQADLAANAAIKAVLFKEFPDDAWLSEEDADDVSRLQKSRVWVVDPLDGTQEFVDHNPEFAVSIGLVVDGAPCVGVICNPVTGELFWGAVGTGVFCDDKSVHVTTPEEGAKLSVLTSRSETDRGEWERFREIFDLKSVGSAAYKMALVAAGRADASFTLQPKSEWDVCAGHALVVAAGGVVTDAQGLSLTYNRPLPRFTSVLYGHAAATARIAVVIAAR